MRQTTTTTTTSDRQLSVAVAARDYWGEEYQHAAYALSTLDTYAHRRAEALAWAQYERACRRLDELQADRAGICYPALEWALQAFGGEIRRTRSSHEWALQGLQQEVRA